MTNVWRGDFDVLSTKVYGHDLAYLDNAATTQMPRQVRERLASYYAHEHANVHRGAHYLSERATDAMERAREHVASFIGAAHADEVIFTSGATDSLNMVASGVWSLMGGGKAVVVSDLEHHSNFVPWQRACEEHGVPFIVWHAHDGELPLAELERILVGNDVGLVAFAQVSNVTGAVAPAAEVASLAHRFGAIVVVDGAQGILHEGIDVGAAQADFYAFSAHKMCGPTGTGVLYGRRELLEALVPARFGGGMVDVVGETRTTFGALPYRLEAGTPNIAGIVGLDAAVTYLEAAGLREVRAYERHLTECLVSGLEEVESVRVLGHPHERSAVVSFALDGAHAFDVAFYNDERDIEALCEGLALIRKVSVAHRSRGAVCHEC